MKYLRNARPRFIALILFFVSVLGMCSFVFADTIELEFGYDALEEYKTYQLPDGEYISGDETIISIDEHGLVTAEHFGDTTISVISEGEIIETIQVIVYLVGDEPVPWGSVAMKRPYVSGYPSGEFKAEQYITRAEAASIFYNLLNEEDKGQQGYWAENAIEFVLESQMMTNRSEGFSANSYLTKGELAIMISSYADQKELVLNPEPSIMMPDVPFTSPYFTAVHEAINARLFDVAEGHFYPEAYLTRGEVISLINVMTGREHMEMLENPYNDLYETDPYYQAILNASHFSQ